MRYFVAALVANALVGLFGVVLIKINLPLFFLLQPWMIGLMIVIGVTAVFSLYRSLVKHPERFERN